MEPKVVSEPAQMCDQVWLPHQHIYGHTKVSDLKIKDCAKTTDGEGENLRRSTKIATMRP